MDTKPAEVALAARETAPMLLALASLDQRIALAEHYAASSLLPEAFRKQSANVLIALDWGAELGLSPLAAIYGINVIQGRPALGAQMMMTLARKAGHRVRITESTPTRATCQIVRADDPDFPQEVTFTMEDARLMGLAAREMWKKQPDVMLRWRAIAACVRLACPEALAGVNYTPDEIEDFAHSAPSERTHPAPARRSVPQLMRAVGVSPEEFRAYAGKLLGLDGPATWNDLDDLQREAVHGALEEWADTGVPPVPPAIVEGEVVEEAEE